MFESVILSFNFYGCSFDLPTSPLLQTPNTMGIAENMAVRDMILKCILFFEIPNVRIARIE